MSRVGPLVLVLAAACLLPASARAQSVIEHPGDRPDDRGAIEPHLLVAPFAAPDAPYGPGVGAGLRASITVVPNGFVKSINDAVAIGFGGDVVFASPRNGGVNPSCLRFEEAPNGTRVCVEATGGSGGATYLYFPVVLDWTFYLTRHWSVFGEPGVAPYWRTTSLAGRDRIGAVPVLYAGGHYRFGRAAALTLRVGYPDVSVGVSFFL